MQRAYVERVKWCLEWLADSAGVSNRLLQVYEVENLLGQLTAHANCPKSPFVIEDLLKTSSYDHDTCTRCSFHEQLECSHCSLGICHTYCYVSSELLCRMFGVSVTRKHLPIISQEVTSAPVISSPSSGRTRQPSDMESVSSRVSVDSVPVGLGRGAGRGRARLPSAGFPSIGRGRIPT